MARVLLVMPRLPQMLGAPYLGQLYVAAALMRDGHEVRCVDLSARHAPQGEAGEAMAEEAAVAFAPDVIGMTLFTYSAARGYRLARRLRPYARLLVAGGPHPTVRRDEPLAHGFDVSVAGEGEWKAVALARHLDGAGGELEAIPGVTTRAGKGPPAPPLSDLDGLPWPHEAYDAVDMTAYDPSGRAVVPGGTMTSRGCPARCTFCANYVTGRAFRYRSPADCVGEMVALRRGWDVRHFSFWDDAFTALRPRLEAMCDAIDGEPALRGTTWSCITPANMVKPRDLARMRRAGCVAVNFGIESGDPTVLKIIRKGQRPAQVVEAVRAAKAEGMTTIVNFMFGFPGEGTAELATTRALMGELSAHTDYFNHRGVLVPFPGTSIYTEHAEAYGFERWWLDEAMVPLEPEDADPIEAMRLREVDPTLALDFFRYDNPVRDAIAECVRFKAVHNRRVVERMTAHHAAEPQVRTGQRWSTRRGRT